MFSSDCDTIVPSTTGRCSRALPIRRATTNARDGSPSRAGSVADISTPMKVPCRASRRRTRECGSAARRIACHANARSTIEKHISPSPTITQGGAAFSSAWPIRSVPMRCIAMTASASAKTPTAPIASRRAIRAPGREASRAVRASAGSSVGRRRAATRSPSAGTRPRRADTPCGARRVQLDRVVVGREHLRRDVRPCVARRGLGRGGGELRAAAGVEREVAQRLGERGRIAARYEQPVVAVLDDVAVARDVRGDHRRAGRERLGQHHAEALAAERRRAQHVGVGQHLQLLLVAALAVRDDVARVEHQRRHLLGVDADDVKRRGDVLAQRLERAQQHRQALALDGLADERDPQRVARLATAPQPLLAAGDVDAVGDDPVRAAVEAAPGPGGGLRDGDPHVQAVQAPARAEEVREVVGEDVLRVAVERRDERRVDGHQRVPAGDRRDRLVQVHDVVAALELAPQRDDRRDAVGDVRDRAVGREADRPPERHEVVGQLALRRARAAVQAPRQAIVRIDRREHAHVVAGGQVVLGERLDVARHSPRIRPRIRRHQRDPHRGILSRRPVVGLGRAAVKRQASRASRGSPRM